MGKRFTSRRLAMQALYQAEIAKTEISQAIANVFTEQEYLADTTDFATKLALGTWEKKDEIDEIIRTKTKDWDLERLTGVDRNILRLALFEMTFLPKTPVAVVINEALEMAKKYSTPESAKFINGILGAAQNS
jgi:N utilization substance protein B